jgi:uncharacterized membrane protein
MASPQLEQYLETIEARLKNLPAPQRQEEILEIRQHLEALVAGHYLAGLSQDEAVATAIRQFGHAEQIGQALNQVSRQQRIRSFWLLVIYCLTVAINLAIFIVNDNPDSWFAKFALALSLPAGILGIGLVETVQNWRRART